MSRCKESLNDLTRLSRKTKRLFKFCPSKITKIEPIGNRRRGTKCPEPRSGHRIVVHGGNVYAFGGYNPHTDGDDAEPPQDRVLFKELWKFNCASRTWVNLETTGKMPDELASHCAVLLDNVMLVFGGTGVPFGESSSNSTHICNLEKLEWTTLTTTGGKPLEQYGQAMAVHNNKMYVVGGTTGYDYSMTVHCLDLATREWETLERKFLNGIRLEPEPRYRHEIAIEGNQLYVFGGGTAFDSFGFREIPVFNLDDYTWRCVPTSEECPAARRCHGCVQMGSDVYICGGIDGTTVFSDIWKFNLKTLHWEKLPAALPTQVYFHSAALSEAGQLFIFGGVTCAQENRRTNDLCAMWVKIPSLAEMCWQAVLSYTPHIAQLEKRKLFEAGIPMFYLNQIDFEDSEKENIRCCKLLSS